MPDADNDRSQEPTPHRRQKAREEGSVARSHDLVSAALLLAGAGALLGLGGGLVHFLAGYTQDQLGGNPWLRADLDLAASHTYGLARGLARTLLPILGALLATAVAMNLFQVGFLFLPQKIGLDLARVDPLAGLRRTFSLANVVRLGFGLFKVAVIGVVAAMALRNELPAVLGLAQRSVPEIAAYLGQVLVWTTLKIGLALVVLAILDYGFQWWRHEQDLRMTPQEVREEMRNLEGDPHIRARRRAVQRQLVMNRLSQAVPKADVVVTNPTELAVAIQYDPKTMAAPVVVAKGAGILAQRIRQLALKHGIPVIERKPLAQALYREVEVGRSIPQDKYAAVAELLAYVYRLKGKKFTAA